MDIQEQSQKQKQQSFLKRLLADIFDMLVFTVFVGGIVLFVRFFVVNPFIVVGQSMEPTFHQNDFIVIDKITPKFGEQLQRGDVIVFVPQDERYPFIKRVIGLPGETVIITGGKVYICSGELTQMPSDLEEACSLLPEPYLASGTQTQIKCVSSSSANGVFPLTSGYFVMGDNRSHSADSRCCFGLGCYSGSSWEVTQDQVLGKVYVRLLPQFDKDF